MNNAGPTVTSVDIRSDGATRAVYATDNSVYQVTPAAVATPTTAADIQELLRSNHGSATPLPIAARGGGTGTNGQSLTDGLMIDVKRSMSEILSIDVDDQTAWVQPGIVAGELNDALRAHNLFWAPHTSTANRSTVGGMIATDAAGKGSLIHGRAHRHVLALDVVLADGTPFRAEPIMVAEAQRRAAESGPVGRIWGALLALPITEDTDLGFPELARGFSGYGLDRFRHDGMLDPVPLLVGSEGTLAVTTAAKLRLTSKPQRNTLIVASYPSFATALEDAVELRDTSPSAIESFDERTLNVGRSSPAWSALEPVVGDHHGSVLLLEYEDRDVVALDSITEQIRATGRSTQMRVIHEPAEQAMAWKVRSDAVGLLARIVVGEPKHAARPTAFVEDCAVPVESMCEFISDFRTILDSYGVDYAMFGHADVGCIHVRPALDTTDPEHEQLLRSITDSVVNTIDAYGGILWGEHGRGYRGEHVDAFLPPETIELMRLVKSAFDPDDIMNPGKLYRPAGSNEPLIALDAPPLRGHANRLIPVQTRSTFSSAFACNGNGVCHHHAGAELMCPSYKVTRDPALSPKGRADLLREWLRRTATEPEQSTATAELADDIADNLGRCLSCSACTGQCPVEVDIPELKSQFLEQYHQKRRRPLSHAVLSRFESLAFAAARAPRLAGLGSGMAEKIFGLTDLPTPKPRVHHGVPVFDPAFSPAPDLVVLQDVFTSALEPATLRKAVAVLSELGWNVQVSPFVPSGKFDHVKGLRNRFAATANAQATLIRSIADSGARAVSIEPATASLHHHEYPRFASQSGHAVHRLGAVIAERAEQLHRRDAQQVRLLGHCTERALSPESIEEWQMVLESAGHQVDVVSTGCCGMAGIFGHESANQTESRALWDLTWAGPVSEDVRAVATGYSCRSQAERFGTQRLDHPVHLL
jgi:FAD/FMN-containing dehydrogenase/Fe-S oxidoreductase